MFRTRPPAYALACVALWIVQLAVNVWLVYANQLTHAGSNLWLLLNLATTVVLGVLIVLQVPRALQWRPRRSIRPSYEVKLERQRIARDLHDQVGSQLVHAMALVDRGNPAMLPLAKTLEHCLLDLRLLVDSMGGDDDALTDRLARLRHRIQPSLDQRGIALQWSVMPAEGVAMPMGAPARELTAIVQEAVSNVLQHSGATALTIVLQHIKEEGGGAWQLQIIDNGKGLPVSPTGHAVGHGTISMQKRAAKAGGRLELLPGPGLGLCVQVTVPAGS